MGSTALVLVQTACYEANLVPPSALVGGTDASVLQLLYLFYATGKELRSCRVWPQLKRFHTVVLEPGRTQYPLPEDYYSAIPDTTWDEANTWSLETPISDSEWGYRTLGVAQVANRRAFRVFGPDANPSDNRGQLYISPAPADGDALDAITFEYVSKSWLLPPLWTASATISQNTYRFCNGNIYKKSDASSEVGSTVPPSLGTAGIGQDGGVWWAYFSASAWAGTTAYQAGTYVTNGGNLYMATASGTSASSGGPTGTSTTTSVTDGTVTWLYKSSSTWAAYTTYDVGAHVLKSSNRYRAVSGPFRPTGLKSGATGPTWDATTQPDGNITWQYQTAPYEALVTDSDLSLFDDELMIAGLKWRFLRARGLDFQSLKSDYEIMKGKAVARWNPGRIISLGGGRRGRSIAPSVSEGNWGN